MIDLGLVRCGLASQLFSVLFGSRVGEFGDGEATIKLDLKQQNTYVHGGVFSCLADNPVTFAGGSVLGPVLLKGGFTIDDVRPAVDVTLRPRGVAIQAGRSRATCRCDVCDADGQGEGETLRALAQDTVIGRWTAAKSE